MSGDEQPEDNTLALIDAVKDWAEGLRGMVAVLRDDGWNDEPGADPGAASGDEGRPRRGRARWGGRAMSDPEVRPVLETTVEAASLAQAHEIAREQGVKFYGVPAPAIQCRALAARATVVTGDGLVLAYEVDFEVWPVIVLDERDGAGG